MIDLAYLQGWVGRECRRRDELTPFAAQALAAALDREHLPQSGEPLPPGWQWLYFLDTPRASVTAEDGHPARHPESGGFLPPVPLPRRMWAAGAMEVERPLVLGRPAEKDTLIRSVDAKTGSSGALVFVRLEHTLSQQGRVCIRETQDLVFRDRPSSVAPLPPGQPAPAAAHWTRRVTPDPVLLFRYSALTFNAHRIHYDRSYAIEQERYPALVVHGPLLATLLLELTAAVLPDDMLHGFRFKALRPTFDTSAFTVNARRDGSQLELWTADADGYRCMSAEAQLA